MDNIGAVFMDFASLFWVKNIYFVIFYSIYEEIVQSRELGDLYRY